MRQIIRNTTAIAAHLSLLSPQFDQAQVIASAIDSTNPSDHGNARLLRVKPSGRRRPSAVVRLSLPSARNNPKPRAQEPEPPAQR